MQELVLKLAESFGYGVMGQIAVVLSVLLFLLFKGLYSLNLDRAKARQEFLQLWDFERAKRDPLWCEVLVRHYCRQFLPAKLVVNVASKSQAADTLWALSYSVRLYRLDDGLLHWRNKRHANPLYVAFAVILGFGLYFVLAMFSLALLLVSVRSFGATSGYLIVLMALAGLLLGVAAIKALNHGFDLGGAHQNFLKIQRMQPWLVPQPMKDWKDVFGSGLFGSIGKRSTSRRSTSPKQRSK